MLDRQQHQPLPPRSVEVRGRLSRAGVLERPFAAEMLKAAVKVDVLVGSGLPSGKERIVKRLRDRDIDPAKHVNHLSKGLEINGDPIVHGLAGHVGHRRRGQVASSSWAPPSILNVWEALSIDAEGLG